MYQKEIIPDNVVNELKDRLTQKLMFFVDYIRDNDFGDNVIDIKFKKVIGNDYKKLIPIIAELAKKKSKQYVFELVGCDLGDDGVKILINEILSKKINVLELDISGNNITYKSEAAIADLITRSNIHYLVLNKGFYKDPIFGSREVFREAVLSNETLLCLEGGQFSAGFETKIHLDEIIKQKLQANKNKFDECKRKIEQENKRQKTIQWDAQKMESKIELKDMELMSSIFEENIKMTRAISAISKQNDFIEIKFNEDVKLTLNKIFDELSKKTDQYSLSFEQCKLSNLEVATLIRCIIENKVRVIKLNLSFNNLSSDCVTEIFALLARTNIQELDLSRTFLSIGSEYYFNTNACGIIKDGVKTSHSICKLSLNGHTVNDKDAEIINARLEANSLRAELKKAQTKVNTLDKEVNQLKTENDTLHKKIATANDTIKVLDKTHKELFGENANLKSKLKHFRKIKEAKVIVAQSLVRTFLAKKHYKHELHIKKVQKENELHKKEIKEEITKALQNNDYSTVGTLSTLLNQNKIEDAMQIIHGQKNLISFNK